MKKLLLLLLCLPCFGFAQDGVTFISQDKKGTIYHENGNIDILVKDSVLNGVYIGRVRARFYKNGKPKKYWFYIKQDEWGVPKEVPKNSFLNKRYSAPSGHTLVFEKEWYENGYPMSICIYSEVATTARCWDYKEKHDPTYVQLSGYNGLHQGMIMRSDHKCDCKANKTFYPILPTKIWYEDGSLKYDCNYRNGQKDGVVKEWYEDGSLKYESNYKNGQKDGVVKEWYENNQLKYEGNYKNGQKDGVVKEWYENGQLKYEGRWKENDELSFKEWDEDSHFVKEFSFLINNVDIRYINEYNIEDFIEVFLKDCKSNGIRVSTQNIKCKFKFLPSPIIALAYSMNDNSKITIEVDPERWEEASIETKWYIIYHELGHDVLNLEHGHGGKMMFPIADDSYDWDEFFEDKKNMFEYYKKKNR